MRLLCAGSGTGGPVVPLIAIIEELQRRKELEEVLFLGESGGIAETLTERHDIPFQSFPAGKLRRYASWHTLGLPFVLLKAFMRARHVIQSFKPDAFVSAGGYIAPPIAWACRSVGVPVLIHVQDSAPLLSDKLMYSSATRITVAWQQAFDVLPVSGQRKAVVTGNPYRRVFRQDRSASSATQSSREDGKPTLICMGGGGGAQSINEIIWAIRAQLQSSFDIIHITGHQAWPEGVQEEPGYMPIAFTPDIARYIADADIALSRAGFSSMTELAVSQTPTILVPLPPSTAQQTNARVASETGAAIVLQQDASHEEWIRVLTELASNPEQQEQMKQAFLMLFPLDATQRVADELLSTARTSVRS